MAVLFSRFTDFHIDFSLAPTNRRWRQSTLSADWLALRGACGVKLLLSSRHRRAGSRPTLENSPCFLYFLSGITKAPRPGRHEAVDAMGEPCRW